MKDRYLRTYLAGPPLVLTTEADQAPLFIADKALNRFYKLVDITWERHGSVTEIAWHFAPCESGYWVRDARPWWLRLWEWFIGWEKEQVYELPLAPNAEPGTTGRPVVDQGGPKPL